MNRFFKGMKMLKQARNRSVPSVFAGALLLGTMAAVSSPGAAAFAACPPVTAPVTAPIALQLQGALQPGDVLMRDDLRRNGVLPTAEPYAALGYPMRGGEANTAALGDPTISTASSIVDWVLVELRDPIDPSIIVATNTVTVFRDGSATLASFLVTPGNYFVAVEHRNHLGAMTASPIAVSATATPLTDFGDPNTPVWQLPSRPAEDRDLRAGRAYLRSGDANNDGQIYATGPGNDEDAIVNDYLGGDLPNGYRQDYNNGDVSMDSETYAAGPRNDRDWITNYALGNDFFNRHYYEQLPGGPHLAGADDPRYTTCPPSAEPTSDPTSGATAAPSASASPTHAIATAPNPSASTRAAGTKTTRNTLAVTGSPDAAGVIVLGTLGATITILGGLTVLLRRRRMQ